MSCNINIITIFDCNNYIYMNFLNPDKYLRAAYITALESATGLKVWHKRIPKNVTAPSKYIILDSLSKNETLIAKPSEGENKNTYFEWACTVDVNIYNVNVAGYSNAAQVDDVEQKVISIVRSGIEIPNFKNRDTRILESLDLSAETTTQSIDRKMVKFEHVLDRVEVITPEIELTVFYGSKSSVPTTSADILTLNRGSVLNSPITYGTGMTRIQVIAVHDSLSLLDAVNTTSGENLTDVFVLQPARINVEGALFKIYVLENAIIYDENNLVRFEVAQDVS